MATPKIPVAIVGAGPAGLAVSGCLVRAGIQHVLLDEADRVGSRWHHHYDRLHLHTTRALSSLPHQAMPAAWPTYVPRGRFAAYLGDYAERMGLRPRLGVRVASVTPQGDGFELETSDGRVQARRVVIAAGYNHTPNLPEFAGADSFRGAIEHSRFYRNGASLRGKRVLVVGAGNSGAEIALDLWEHGAFPLLCVRGPLHVTPRDLGGVPAQYTAQLMAKLPLALADRLTLRMLDRVVGDLSPWGITRPEDGPVSGVVQRGKIPLIDVGTLTLIKQGQIEVVPGIRRFDATGAYFENDAYREVDHVVLATGYRPDLAALLGPMSATLVDARGYPHTHAQSQNGLFFIGYRNPLIGALRDIGLEARSIAHQIARTA